MLCENHHTDWMKGQIIGLVGVSEALHHMQHAGQRRCCAPAWEWRGYVPMRSRGPGKDYSILGVRQNAWIRPAWCAGHTLST